MDKYFQYILFSFSYFNAQNNPFFLFSKILRQYNFHFEFEPNFKFKDALEFPLLFFPHCTCIFLFVFFVFCLFIFYFE